MAAKKAVAKKAPVAKKEVKVPKQVRPEPVKKGASVQLVSFEMGAVIPTMQYGNLQPRVVVTAPSLEEAEAVVMPFMAELYRKYAEGKAAFLGKITVEEKIVAGTDAAKKEEAKVEVPVLKAPEATASSVAPSAPSSSESTTPAPEVAVDAPESVRKAEKAISLAASTEAVKMIQTQIENSIKIPSEFKPALLVQCAQKEASFPF